MGIDVSDFLPELTCNKNYVKKKKYLKRKQKANFEREQQINNRLSRGGKKSKKARKDAPDIKVKKMKVRKPKTVVSGVKTGKTTLLKKKARALVQEAKANKKKKQAPSNRVIAAKHTSGKSSSKELKIKDKRAHKVKDTPRVPKKRTPSSTLSSSVHREEEESNSFAPGVQASNSSLTSDELDRMLIEQTIRGRDYAVGDETLAHARDFIREDPTLYPPEVAFCEDLAEEKEGEDVTEDALLNSAHRYFKELNAKDQKIRESAAAYLKKMRAINRRGGDKDGFRYVLPSSVKQVARQMMLASSAAEGNGNQKGSSLFSSLAMVDTTALDSTFNGDGVRSTEKKPMRSRRRRPSTFSDFYKFQVSKRWTQNAESFLNRGRAHKALFEAKKRQRSIRKL